MYRDTRIMDTEMYKDTEIYRDTSIQEYVGILKGSRDK